MIRYLMLYMFVFGCMLSCTNTIESKQDIVNNKTEKLSQSSITTFEEKWEDIEICQLVKLSEIEDFDLLGYY